ncbi:hypothetical protein MTO98_24085 [Mucilaginibacter sp. SMC90]|uniref:hypothetical protein n=1 Tax=Mucilaginibacter sp. SMC90 TaxID=2929803 RepID=UPI001FB3105B|nr:hypothetical protein [Mucilaginibacter sp. SMC90]UOE47492.1 hypothetical protein MTO98_24085 [Mucilaginibacter sp. SMC90]
MGSETTPDMLLEIIGVRRNEFKLMHRNQEFTDELIRAKERELDIEEGEERHSSRG